MSKYGPLSGFLQSQLTARIVVTFSEVEEALGAKLPASAYAHPAWWSNDPTGHAQARAWLNAGFETEQVDIPGRKLVFRRITPGGMEDQRSMFKHAAPDPSFEKVDRHPAAGAMKGAFTIEPGTDLTRPALDNDELAAIDANLDRLVDIVERGRSSAK